MKKISPYLIGLMVLALIFALAQVIPPFKQERDNTYIAEQGQRSLIIAQRGGRGLFPENTFTAFQGAVTAGADMLAFEVCLTKDDILVVSHDLSIDRTSDGKGLIRSYSYEELVPYNFGYSFRDAKGDLPYREEKQPLPKLSEVLTRYAPIPMYIEIRDKEEDGLLAARKLSSLLAQYNTEDSVIVSSFEPKVMREFRQASEGRVRTASTMAESTRFILAQKLMLDWFLFSKPFEILQVPENTSGLKINTTKLIQDAHKHGLAVYFWTVDDQTRMRLLLDEGADGIMTNRPDVMRELFDWGYYRAARE